ncbi:unnamed protein product [Ixodes pacificus]
MPRTQVKLIYVPIPIVKSSGIRARAYSLATKSMGSAGAVIPIVISLQTTSPSRTSATSTKAVYSPRVATARVSNGSSGSWW